VLTLLCALTIAGAPLTPQTSLDVRFPGSPQVSPDGKRVVFHVKSRDLAKNRWETQLYEVPINGGPARQLTTQGRYNGQAAWAPDGKRLVFVSGREDGRQLHVIDLVNGGEARAITDLSGGASSPVWSPDGRHIAFTSDVFPECRNPACNVRRAKEESKRPVAARAYDDLLYRHWTAWGEETVTHVMVVGADGGDPRDVTPGPDHSPPAFLGGGRGYGFVGNDRLVFSSNHAHASARSTNHDLFVVPLNKPSQRKRITDNPAWDAGPLPSPDGKRLAYLRHRRPGFEADRIELWIWEPGKGHVPRTESFDRSVREVAWFADGSGLYFTAVNRGVVALYSVGADAGEPTALITDRSVGGLSVAPDGAVLFISARLDRAPELEKWSPSSKAISTLTDLNRAALEGVELGRVEDATITHGTTPVHGLVMYPPGFDAKRPAPLLLLIHGGPQGAWRHGWSSRWNPQVFAAAGYVVAMPNPRGSVGYGQAFTDAVTGNWGGGPYEDVMAFGEGIAKKTGVDGERVCAAGASYGGYMVNWIAGHSTRFDCLISHAGLFDLQGFYGDTEELWFPEWEFGGPPWEARETYRRWSPHLFVHNAKTPTLVIHGQLDYRVDLSHGLGMFTALRRLGVPARLVYFPDEGHWIKKPKNYVYWFDQMLGWLQDHLR